MFSDICSLRKQTVFIIVLLFFFSPFFSMFASFVSSSEPCTTITKEGAELFVDQNNQMGPWTGSAITPFKKISQALSCASPYDKIYISDGMYNESLSIKIPVNLIGIDTPIINGNNAHTIVKVTSDDVVLHNLEVIHSFGGNNDSGIYIDHCSNVTISDCVIHHTKTGIFLNQSSNVSIDSTMIFHSGNGIRVDHSSEIIIQSCDFARNSLAILSQDSTDITVNFSSFRANGMSGCFYQSSQILVGGCELTDNSVNKGGLFLSNTQMIAIVDTLFKHNGVGVSLSNVSTVEIQFCEFKTNTHFAVAMRDASADIFISNSVFSHNLRNGIYIETGNSCTITESHIIDNYGYGILSKPGSFCNATNNWWNTSLGPFYGLLTKSNKISMFQGIIHSFPWEKAPITDVGLRITPPMPRYNHTYDETILIKYSEKDTDSDGIPDWWEERWGYSITEKNDHYTLDPDEDGLSNAQECYTSSYGSDPFHKDIFLEIDWMHCTNGESNKPELAWLQPIIDDYADHDITLHIDIGQLGGGEEIFYQCEQTATYAALEDMYWTYFLENDMNNPRKNIFHYGVLCNFCPDLNFPFVGWNSLDSFAISVEWLSQEYPHYGRQQIIVGGIAHHLGHTLGLIADSYEGIDNMETLRVFSSEWKEFYRYQSCMNYFYKYREFCLSDGTHGRGDFNDWVHLDLSYFQKGTYESV